MKDRNDVVPDGEVRGATDRMRQALMAPRCDRAMYHAWLTGTLLDMRRGRGTVVDELEVRKVDQALAMGQIAVLTIDGVPKTVVIPGKDVDVEHMLESCLSGCFPNEPT